MIEILGKICLFYFVYLTVNIIISVLSEFFGKEENEDE